MMLSSKIVHTPCAAVENIWGLDWPTQGARDINPAMMPQATMQHVAGASVLIGLVMFLAQVHQKMLATPPGYTFVTLPGRGGAPRAESSTAESARAVSAPPASQPPSQLLLSRLSQQAHDSSGLSTQRQLSNRPKSSGRLPDSWEDRYSGPDSERAGLNRLDSHRTASTLSSRWVLQAPVSVHTYGLESSKA